jgi:hypothetical protein
MSFPPHITPQEAGRRGARMRWRRTDRGTQDRPLPEEPPTPDPGRLARLERILRVATGGEAPARCWVCRGPWRWVRTGAVCYVCAREVIIESGLGRR